METCRKTTFRCHIIHCGNDTSTPVFSLRSSQSGIVELLPYFTFRMPSSIVAYHHARSSGYPISSTPPQSPGGEASCHQRRRIVNPTTAVGTISNENDRATMCPINDKYHATVVFDRKLVGTIIVVVTVIHAIVSWIVLAQIVTHCLFAIHGL